MFALLPSALQSRAAKSEINPRTKGCPRQNSFRYTRVRPFHFGNPSCGGISYAIDFRRWIFDEQSGGTAVLIKQKNLGAPCLYVRVTEYFWVSHPSRLFAKDGRRKKLSSPRDANFFCELNQSGQLRDSAKRSRKPVKVF